MNFTKTQLAAINHTTGNLQLIACAGSGKTEVVARRVATLLKAGAKPGNIIAFTFTDSYAALMLKLVLRFWTPRYRVNPRLFAVCPLPRANVRLFHLASILGFIERCEVEAKSDQNNTGEQP